MGNKNEERVSSRADGSGETEMEGGCKEKEMGPEVFCARAVTKDCVRYNDTFALLHALLHVCTRREFYSQDYQRISIIEKGITFCLNTLQTTYIIVIFYTQLNTKM